jgi:IclR family transcriptional regulator, KDG regulon repressor
MILNNNYSVPSIDRAIDILEVLSNDTSQLSLHRLSQLMGVPKSSLFRILHTLEKRQFIKLDEQSSNIRLGYKMWELSIAPQGKSELINISFQLMNTLEKKFGGTVFLGILEDLELLIIKRIGMINPNNLFRNRKRKPLYSTASGQIILANQNDQFRIKYFSETNLINLRSSEEIKSDFLGKILQNIQKNGYAISSGEFAFENIIISAPIWDSSSKVFASMSIELDKHNISESNVTKIINEIKNTSRKISRNLGYQN